MSGLLAVIKSKKTVAYADACDLMTQLQNDLLSFRQSQSVKGQPAEMYCNSQIDEEKKETEDCKREGLCSENKYGTKRVKNLLFASAFPDYWELCGFCSRDNLNPREDRRFDADSEDDRGGDKRREIYEQDGEEVVGYIMILEHDLIYTAGRNTKSHDLLALQGVISPDLIVDSPRGGMITCHAPGQLILYFVVDLMRYYRDFSPDIKHFIANMQDVVSNFLWKKLGILSQEKKGYPGLWVDQSLIQKRNILSDCGKKLVFDQKQYSLQGDIMLKCQEKTDGGTWFSDGEFNIKYHCRADQALDFSQADKKNNENRLSKLGFIGLRVSRWITSHGISLNVLNQENHFAKIDAPCGIEDCAIAAIEDYFFWPRDICAVGESADCNINGVGYEKKKFFIDFIANCLADYLLQ